MPKKYGSPFVACAVVGCNGDAGRPGAGRGYCGKHYRRWRLYGDPIGVAEKQATPPEQWVDGVALAFEGEECLIWPFGRNEHGYAVWTRDRRPQIASRLICQMVHGDPPALKLVAAHSCCKGHEGCVNPKHLRWATASENEQDKLLSGTSNRGERHGLAKLTEADVVAIRTLVKTATHAAVAAKFGVSKWTVLDIVRRKRWGWLA